MRCQYCGKRLPLFRKLKDGEFCSAAHREQFIAQADQLALATLQEQRARMTQAKAAEPQKAPDAAFSNRYLPPSLTAHPLRQLARVPQEPTAVAVLPYMPERPAMPVRRLRTPRVGEWESVPAESVLRALADYRALSEEKEPAKPAAPLTFARTVITATTAEVPLPMAGPVPLGSFGKPKPVLRLAVPVAAWARSPRPVASRRLLLSPDPACLDLPRDRESTQMAGYLSFAVNPAAPAADLPLAAEAILRASTLKQPPREYCLLPSISETAGLAALPAESVAIGATLATVAVAVMRFPALTPTFSMMPPRTRAALDLAAPAIVTEPIRIVSETLASPALPVFSGVVVSEVALGKLLTGPTIAGQLADLLPALVPAGQLAPRQKILWRVEAQSPPPFHTLAVRPAAITVAMRKPALALAAVGPRRADQQLRLNSIVRPAKLTAAANSGTMCFHLEPRVLRPRLRALPDPARQGMVGRGRGKNQADAAVASIKIPVLRRFWAHAPADIRWVALVLPLVFFLAWYSWTPNGKKLNQQAKSADLAVDTSGVQTMFASFKSRISSRAAVELGEDFRAGLAQWQGAREDWAENWSYDQTGFVRPGNLAIFTPTITLHDYNFEFLGQIESRAMSWVYRAKDTRNYYQGKLVITQGGPVPEIAFVRTIVKNGRETGRKSIPLTMNLRTDTLYRVRVDVNPSDFTTSVLGQVVDTFSDTSHEQGGIGFQGGRGETSRIRWVEVSHQYDTLGRLCAMLVPYGMAGATLK
ncbi:MAG: hypothetical protein K2X03_27960 [Bryobacteraceae bacterium]|nr:hypothetical protein [Bryobacteraceae bacterium]